MTKTKIAIFASGRGSNAKSFIEHSQGSNYSVEALICNKSGAMVLDLAKKHGIANYVIDKAGLANEEMVLELLAQHKVEWIILAGFVLLIPPAIISKFPNRILNIHPSLLPKYGGKGMYGMRVHRAVFQNRDSISGITIHYVNEHFDEGEIVVQKQVDISKEDSPEGIAKKVLSLEHKYYPETLEKLIHQNE